MCAVRTEAVDYYQLCFKEGHRGARDSPIQCDLLKNSGLSGNMIYQRYLIR